MSSPDHHKITGCVRNESQTKKVPDQFLLGSGRFLLGSGGFMF